MPFANDPLEALVVGLFDRRRSHRRRGRPSHDDRPDPYAQLPRTGEVWRLDPPSSWRRWSYLDEDWVAAGDPPSALRPYAGGSGPASPRAWRYDAAGAGWVEIDPGSRPQAAVPSGPIADAPGSPAPSVVGHTDGTTAIHDGSLAGERDDERRAFRRRQVATASRLLRTGSVFGGAVVVLALAEMYRWAWWVLRSVGPFVIGTTDFPEPPAYPPSPSLGDAGLMLSMWVVIMASTWVATALVSRAQRGLH